MVVPLDVQLAETLARESSSEPAVQPVLEDVAQGVRVAVLDSAYLQLVRVDVIPLTAQEHALLTAIARAILRVLQRADQLAQSALVMVLAITLAAVDVLAPVPGIPV